MIMAGPHHRRRRTPKACCRPAAPTSSRSAARWLPIRTGASRRSARSSADPPVHLVQRLLRAADARARRRLRAEPAGRHRIRDAGQARAAARAGMPDRRTPRVLVLGGGRRGVEAARVCRRLAAIRSRSGRTTASAGGQMPLALAAPDKDDVSGVWTYRVEALEQLGVPIRTGVDGRPSRRSALSRRTWSSSPPAPRRATLPSRSRTDVPGAAGVGRAAPSGADPPGPSVTIIGGGMVGIETAECIARRAGAASRSSKVKASSRRRWRATTGSTCCCACATPRRGS